ncbi:MAG: hypothetical protein KAH57_00320 [Thermoplasmata archaeon]|nr:hypothetical protein [Thermoplasmata archaeon]
MKVFFLFTLALTLSILSFAGVVMGDTEPNGEQYLAESVNDGAIYGRLDPGTEDHIDWYVMDIPPFTDVKITLAVTSISGNVNAVSYWEDLEIEGSIYLSTSGSGSSVSDTFENDGSFEELWLEVAGSGTYQLTISFDQELIGGCCQGFLLLGGLPLVGGFIFIRYRKSRS